MLPGTKITCRPVTRLLQHTHTRARTHTLALDSALAQTGRGDERPHAVQPAQPAASSQQPAASAGCTSATSKDKYLPTATKIQRQPGALRPADGPGEPHWRRWSTCRGSLASERCSLAATAASVYHHLPGDAHMDATQHGPLVRRISRCCAPVLCLARAVVVRSAEGCPGAPMAARPSLEPPKCQKASAGAIRRTLQPSAAPFPAGHAARMPICPPPPCSISPCPPPVATACARHLSRCRQRLCPLACRLSPAASRQPPTTTMPTPTPTPASGRPWPLVQRLFPTAGSQTCMIQEALSAACLLVQSGAAVPECTLQHPVALGRVLLEQLK
jgi:hypothetical protein